MKRKSRFQWLQSIVNHGLLGLRYRLLSRQRIFSEIYRKNLWGDEVSRSGTGSSLEQTVSIRQALAGLLGELRVATFVDAPCGDFNWMKTVPYSGRYIGIDIVPDLIQRNNRLYGGPNREFRCLDLVTDTLPSAELVLCRDALVHLSLRDAERVLYNFRESGMKYLLATTFPSVRINKEIVAGRWRPLNMEIAPFDLGKPLRLLSDADIGVPASHEDKSVGLWRLA